jgi:hypothetical protein
VWTGGGKQKAIKQEEATRRRKKQKFECMKGQSEEQAYIIIKEKRTKERMTENSEREK